MSDSIQQPFDLVHEAEQAEGRIRSLIRETPLEYSEHLSQKCGCRVYLKLENLQVTGSFKIRGAANHILSLSRSEKKRGVITASTGNHGGACAAVVKQTGIKGTIYLPENASGVKLEAIKGYGVELAFHGSDCIETETFARDIAERDGRTYIPPYNHPCIIGGQATIGMELIRRRDDLSAVLVPVGGGGLMAGVAGWLKAHRPEIITVGCQPVNSPVMYESIKEGKIVDMESHPTLSSGTAGGIEKGSLTFDLCRRHVDDWLLVTEDEIRDALLLMIREHRMLVEGAAALPVAALLKSADRFEGQTVVLIITGDKLDPSLLKKILQKQ